MKLLVFAHTPPPHHGQSYMVKLMLDGLGGDARQRLKSAPAGSSREIECYHVNARFSDNMEDIGSFRVTKALLVFRYCVEAIWCRFRHGVRAFYYVPAPGKRAALYRDWMVMILCRPFFRHFIHHWHASGLGDWLRREGTLIERWLTHRLLGHPALGLSLAVPGMRDALWFRSRQVEIVANGIPDPCPDFDALVLPRRQQRLAARRALLAGQPSNVAEKDDSKVFRVLYLAHCTREKGVFDTLEGVLLAQASGSPVRFHLTIAGAFLDPAEENELRARLAAPDCAGPDSCVTYAGFVSGEQKAALLRTSDAFCFPTYYPAEGQPVNLIEAMACGLTIVTTRWRGIPELLPADHPGFVMPRSPEAVAEALTKALTDEGATQLRSEFVTRFTEARYLQTLREALSGISPVPIPAS
jgi:glycosyltransferase involved in cell wall biosynthesis